jgi:hypothetical protein
MSPFPRGRFMRRREAGEEAVAARGCKHAHPPRGGPSRARPGRQDSRSLGRSQVAARVRPSCHWQGPAAVGTNVTPPGIARSKPQTPCAERRATGGLAVIRTSACLDAARRRGPWVRAAFGLRGLRKLDRGGTLAFRAPSHVGFARYAKPEGSCRACPICEAGRLSEAQGGCGMKRQRARRCKEYGR